MKYLSPESPDTSSALVQRKPQSSSQVTDGSLTVRKLFRLLLVFGPKLVLSGAGASADEPVSFSRDVLPILSDRCFYCHGPDDGEREADLRLDQRTDVIDSGVIVPGDPDASEFITRVTTDDADLRMPPVDSHRKSLTEREIQVLRSWITDGAEWGRHWAFEQPARPNIPDTQTNPVDAFVKSRLDREGLEFSDEASQHTLIRRVSFDLTGLPPTVAEFEEVLNDGSSDAYESFIDRLLQSPRYGERMAMWWLDAARYSDTDGYQVDATRTNWPWRDWVVQSFNENMPFDQFTVEQFAGDLLPDATAEQQLATCFHRNHMTNGEGGRDPEESRIDYVIDRVNTTGSVWLGLTLGCCQCHSHKFDPVSQQDYYSLFAFFDSIDEDGKAGSGAKPFLKYRSPHAQRSIDEAQQTVDRRSEVEATVRAQAEQTFERWLAEQITSVKHGFVPWHVLHASTLQSVEGTVLTQSSDGTVQASGLDPLQDDYRIVAPTALRRVTGLRLVVLPHESHSGGKLSRGTTGEFILTNVRLQVRRRGYSQVRDVEIPFAVADVEKSAKGRAYGKVSGTLDDDPRNGWTTESHDPQQPHVAVFGLAEPLLIEEDEELVFVMMHRSLNGHANIGRFRISVTDQPGKAVLTLAPMPLEQLAAADVSDPADIDEKLRSALLDQFLAGHAKYQQVRADLDLAKRQLSEFKKASDELNVMVLAERESPRTTHVLERGVWDQKGIEVPRAFPQAVFPGRDKPGYNRLDLAHWLVSRENPLTARVIVNQLWQMCFGAGLVRTPEDFGLQGEPPSHPLLLDWLAVEFMENNWDVQHILRLIVTSRTYRQSSQLTDQLAESDPDNRLLARRSRFRLPSWMIRDAALRSSGLLNPAVGGPPVMPYQPNGVWAEMFMGRFRYQPSQGSAQYRRTLYAFWRRSAAPTFLFDSAQRRVCETRPRRTNTPLQALTLLNDLSMLESSRALARSALASRDERPARIATIFQSILTRLPDKDEYAVLDRELTTALAHYQEVPEDARQLQQFGQPEQRKTTDAVELAAYTLVTSLIYNLDEAITSE